MSDHDDSPAPEDVEISIIGAIETAQAVGSAARDDGTRAVALDLVQQLRALLPEARTLRTRAA